MAILKQRLNMKTATGYDVVHMETSSDLVQRDNGTNVEDTLNTLTTCVANLSTSVENVTNNITTEVKTIIQEGNATHAETHATGGTDEITPDSIGALSATGTAESAKKLETARTFQINLGSTLSVGFDGTGNVTPGVTGTLGVSNGGTGKTTAPLGVYNLINGCNTLTSDTLVDADIIPVGDVSAATGKTITIEELKNVFGINGTASISDIPTTAGQTCNWGGYNWTVVHVIDDLIYMILTNIYCLTQFNKSNSAIYVGSTIASLCDAFLANFDDAYQSALESVLVEGRWGKVFVISWSQLGTFTWLSSSANQVAYYNGTATAWWTSTENSSEIWTVAPYGGGLLYYPSSTYGFRPCVAVKRT